MTPEQEMTAEQLVDYALGEAKVWGTDTKRLKEFRAELLRRLGASGVPHIESLLDELCTSPDKTYCQRGRTELRKILTEAGASGVDVEGLLKLCAEQVALGKPSYMRETATTHWLEIFMAVLRKHIAQPAVPPIPFVTRATGRTIPDLTKREHVCEWQKSVTSNATPCCDGEVNPQSGRFIHTFDCQERPAPREAEQEESNG